MAPRKKQQDETAEIPENLSARFEQEKKQKAAVTAAKRRNAAQARRVGRPSKYQKSYCGDIIKYFQVEHLVFSNYTDKGARQDFADYDFPTLEGFAAKLLVHRDTLYEWADKHPEFSDSLRVAIGMQADLVQRATAKNILPPNFAALVLAQNHGWTNGKEAAARAKGVSEAEVESTGELPEATAFVVTVVKDRDDAFYQLWLDAREKNKLLGKDEDEGLEQFELYDENDKDQLKEVAKVRGHLLGLLEMLPDE
ncbi:hypothetical protein [Enterobacter phage ST22]|nr:hypothetical protein [Enterobacter phage ST22]